MIRNFLQQIKKDKRAWKVYATFNTSLLAQAIQIITAIVSVPLTLNYLGNERFGLWMTLSTFLVFINFSDFGIGIGYQNELSKVIVEKNYEYGTKLSTSVWGFVAFIITIFILFTLVALPYFPIQNYFVLYEAKAKAELLVTTQTAFLVLSIGVASGIIQRIYDAFQQGYVVKINTIIARFLSLGLLFLGVNYNVGLPTLILILIGINNISIFLLLPRILRENKWLIPRVKFFNMGILIAMLKKGMLGLLAIISFYLLNSLAPFIISNRLSVSDVAEYSILNRLIGIPITLVTFYVMSLWPAYSDAYNLKDFQWITKHYKRNNIIVLVFSGCAAVAMLLFGQFIIELWIGKSKVIPSFQLLLAFTSFMLFSFWNAQLSVLLNALSRFKSQAIWGTVFGIGSVGVCYLYASQLGVSGIVFTISIALLLRCIIMNLELNKIFLNELKA